MEHVRQHARAALTEIILKTRQQGYPLVFAEAAMKGGCLTALADGAKSFAAACAIGIPLQLDRDTASDTYKVLIRHRAHAFTHDLFFAADPQLREELDRIESWMMMEKAGHDIDLRAKLVYGLRYNVAHSLLTRHWCDATLPELAPDEIAAIQQDAMTRTAETLSQTHDLAVSRAEASVRAAETRMKLMDLAQPLLGATRSLFSADHETLGAALVLSGFATLNKELEDIPEADLKAGIERAAAIITAARTNGFAFEQIGKVHLDVPGGPPLRLL